MSLTLSLTPHNPFVDHPYSSRSNTISTSSVGTTRYHGAARHYFADSHRTPSQLASRHPQNEAMSSQESFRTIPLNSANEPPGLFEGFSSVGLHIDRAQPAARIVIEDSEEESLVEELKADDESIMTESLIPQVVSKPIPTTFDPSPFRRWLSKLRRREQSESTEFSTRRTRRGKDSSHSSSGFVTGVREGTISISETGFSPKSWVTTPFGHVRGSLWARLGSDDDTVSLTGPVVDELAWARGIQRRKVLEEIVSTEESYVSDLKALINVYFTLLVSVGALTTQAKLLVRQNLSEILDMHENLLGNLHDAIPPTESTQVHANEPPHFTPKGHVRWHSADSGIGKLKDSRIVRRMRHSIDLARPSKRHISGSVADTKTAMAVAKVFESFLPKLFAYEEYGVKYEMMGRSLAATYKLDSEMEAHERGIEVLSRTLESLGARDKGDMKALRFQDLLIKPVQRVLKYPLFFAELVKHTPVADDPEAHHEIEKVLFRLRETAREINRARDDPSFKASIEKTWLLQDRLVFPTSSPSITTRILGHVLLCGVLHIVYQTKQEIKGQYMLCALFKSALVIAIPRKGLTLFDVVASIPLADVSIEEPDSGKGLQCHTAPFSWKLVFESQHRLFEVLMTACSPAEEEQWKKQLSQRNSIEALDYSDMAAVTQDICSVLVLDLKPIGTLSSSSYTGSRRVSIHRALTLGPRAQVSSQVIIRNTESPEHILPLLSSSTSLPISRSKSVASAGYIPVLTPRRSERAHLENALADVWTKETLPFPGMKPHENPFRASAHHLIRKLSMASISSTFSRRSSSYSHMPKENWLLPAATEFGMVASQNKLPMPTVRRPAPVESSVTRPPTSTPAVVVDFHTNPERFLPEDFELKDRRLAKPPRQKLTIRAVSEEGAKLDNIHERKPSLSRLQRSTSTRLETLHEAKSSTRSRTPSFVRMTSKNGTVKEAGRTQPLRDSTKSRTNQMLAPKVEKEKHLKQRIKNLFH